MLTRRSRPAALTLALVWLLTAMPPVAATDPGEPSAAPEASEAPPDLPTVHAEMLAEHANDDLQFTPGDAPAPLNPQSTGGGTTAVEPAGTGGIGGLPNGLRREVFGYLPYWAATAPQLENLNYGLVSTIAYFSVGARSNGTLAKTSGGQPTVGWAGWNSSAMTGVISNAHARGVKVVLTVTMMAWDHNYSAFEALLGSSANRATLATEIANAVKARNADGVNLDFEPMPNSLESQYTAFVRKVKAELVRVGAGSYLTVAVTGGAASWDEGYELIDNADTNSYGLVTSGGASAIMVMAYDFNWSGSRRAGAVAPIDSPYVLDSREAMAAFLAKVPADKLIWGVPYYGRSWTTTAIGTEQHHVHVRRHVPGDELGDAIHRRAPGGRRPRSPLGRCRPGALVPVSQRDVRHLCAGLLRRRPLRSNVKYDMVKANGTARRRYLAPAHGRIAIRAMERLASEFKELPFTDIAGSAFVNDIIWIADQGITTGCGGDALLPHRPRSRAARWPASSREPSTLPAASADYFSDDDGLTHEDNINRMAEAGITTGCSETEFCPAGLVSRGQMASFLDRALGLPAATQDFFNDDDGTAHEDVHQPHRRGRHHRRLHGHPLLSQRAGQPPADGRLPVSRPGALTLASTDRATARARSTYGRARA